MAGGTIGVILFAAVLPLLFSLSTSTFLLPHKKQAVVRRRRHM
jgi:hypothetical protein